MILQYDMYMGIINKVIIGVYRWDYFIIFLCNEVNIWSSYILTKLKQRIYYKHIYYLCEVNIWSSYIITKLKQRIYYKHIYYLRMWFKDWKHAHQSSNHVHR